MTSTAVDRINGARSSLAIKAPCVASSSTNLTLNGAQTVDGVALVAGDRCLVNGQTTTSENGIYCVDPRTEILTKRGFKRHDELIVGEDVLTLNMETGNAEWQPALSVHAFPVQDIDMLSMEGASHSSLSTMNHRWPVSRRRHRPTDIYPRKRYADGTFAEWAEPNEERYFAIRESHQLCSEDYIPTCAECDTLPTSATYSDALVELVGWFITEGHIRKNKSGRLSTCVKIVQSSAVNPDKVERIRTCLTTLFGPEKNRPNGPRGGIWKPEWRSARTSNGRMTAFALNREAGRILCDTAPGKVLLPGFVAALTKRQLKIFVDTCVAADGCTNLSGSTVFVQKRLDMLAPVQMACTLLGIATNVSKAASGIHTMTLLKRTRILPQSNARVTKYSGTVWCPKTKNSTWLARRQGAVYFTGNTVDTGDWERAPDFDGANDITKGTLVKVNGGTLAGFWYLSTSGTDIGTDAVTFTQASSVLAAFSVFMQTLLDDADAPTFRTSIDAMQDVFTTIGDTVVATTAGAAARLAAAANVAAHATTANIWGAREITLTGVAVTFTDIADAPYVGAVAWVKQNAAHVWTNGAVFDVQGNASYTAAAGDWIRVYATTVSTFEVTIFLASGTEGSASKEIYGLTYDNGTDATNDLNINTGGAQDATGARRMTLATALGKQSDVVWAVGGTTVAPAGGLDTGAVGNSDYYVWLITRSDTGVVDALFSLSSTAPTMPANYDYKRLIGWFKRAGGTIVAFKTYETEGGGIEMAWNAPTLDISLAATLTTARRTDAVKVPLNFSTIALLNVFIYDAADLVVHVCCPDQTDAAPTQGGAAPLANLNSGPSFSRSAQLSVRTSAAGLIAARADVATVDVYLVSTMGFSWGRRN